jgi:hypothetical protein
MTTMTVMVPQVTYKTITVPAVVCQPEVRQQTINVCRLVPETTMVTCNTTVMVPERRTSTQTFNVCRMTFESVTTPVTVMVPHTEVRQGTRTVCKPVAVQVTQTVCKDLGSWQTKSYVDRCGCAQTCQVWAPNIVTEQVPVTVYKPQFVEEQFNYTAVVCRPETRNITRQIAKPVVETKTQEVSYIVPVPKQVQREIPQTTYRPVTEQRNVNFTVMVPTRVERQVTIPVCEMVAKQVSVPVCATCSP